ncbi:unnamed protein product [Prunus armeniaca]|uniref:Uncharacterized protein n=1 Tax=Prunus armeniaca TaxID=36596 RepID=A0A6J5WLM8_PRUAR|nr:unnamed protein product [Prunus armeniaca]
MDMVNSDSHSPQTQGCPPPTAVTNPFRCGSSPKGGKQLATKCAPFPWAGIELPTSWLRDEGVHLSQSTHDVWSSVRGLKEGTASLTSGAAG